MTVFQIPGGNATAIAKKITSSTVTDIVDAANGQVAVFWFEVAENSGSTPNLTVELYDVANTTSYYLVSGGVAWVAKAVTAKQGIVFSEGYIVPQGWKLRVTSSDASGKFDVTGLRSR